MALRVGRYEIRRADRLNLRAYEYRKPEPKGKYKDMDVAERWMPLDAFFATMEGAVEWLYNRLLMDGVTDEAMDVAGMLANIQSAKDEIVEAIGGSGGA